MDGRTVSAQDEWPLNGLSAEKLQVFREMDLPIFVAGLKMDIPVGSWTESSSMVLPLCRKIYVHKKGRGA